MIARGSEKRIERNFLPFLTSISVCSWQDLEPASQDNDDGAETDHGTNAADSLRRSITDDYRPDVLLHCCVDSGPCQYINEDAPDRQAQRDRPGLAKYKLADVKDKSSCRLHARGRGYATENLVPSAGCAQPVRCERHAEPETGSQDKVGPAHPGRDEQVLPELCGVALW